MEVIYKRFAELWNSKDEDYNNKLLEELKNQIIFNTNDVRLYNIMPFYYNDILITLLTYSTNKDYVKEFIYLYTCRIDLLDEEFLNNMKTLGIRSIVNLEINNTLFKDNNKYKDIYTYLNNNLNQINSTLNIDFNFNNGYFVKDVSKVKEEYTIRKQISNTVRVPILEFIIKKLFKNEYNLSCNIQMDNLLTKTFFSTVYYSHNLDNLYVSKFINSDKTRYIELNFNKILSSKYVTRMICSEDNIIHYERALGDLKIIRLTQNLKNIIIQMIEGLDYIHSNKIRHLDIKPANFLYYPEGIVKYSDLANCSFTSYHNYQFTLQYRAPEDTHFYIKGYEYDIFSLGMTIYYLINGCNLMNIKTIDDDINLYYISLPGAENYYKKYVTYLNIKDLLKYKKSLDLNTSNPILTDLLKKMIHVDYRKRITLEEIKKHPYFDNYEFPIHNINEKVFYVDQRKCDVFKKSIKYIKKIELKFYTKNTIFTILQLLTRYTNYSYDIDKREILVCIYLAIRFNFKYKDTEPFSIEEIFDIDLNNNYIELILNKVFDNIIRYKFYSDTLDKKQFPDYKDIINSINSINLDQIITFDEYQKMILNL